jgi:2-amino-4-hydroxy-6-hydroxymethyldihydropteridine diphosphokinase
VYVALGANLGDAAATLRDAIRWLADLPGTTVYAASSLYRTAPWEASGPDFINAVAALDTQLTAPDLLVCLHTLEARAGRERPYLNAPRTLDLDLLLYGSAGIDSPRLTVPHPRMWQRAFVLVPLAEVAPEWVTPEALQAVAGQQIERMV